VILYEFGFLLKWSCYWSNDKEKWTNRARKTHSVLDLL